MWHNYVVEVTVHTFVASSIDGVVGRRLGWVVMTACCEERDSGQEVGLVCHLD
jgi:hypothetical protein